MPEVARGPSGDPNLSDDRLLDLRRQWFSSYTSQKNVFAPDAAEPYSCPCCGHRTLDERGAHEICDRCSWEDDGQDDHDSHVVRGGPNGRLSVDDTRQQYIDEGERPEPHTPPSPAR